MDFFDQLGRTIVLREPPKRIVCLVPSITEFLVTIGLEKNIVGITKFCIHPSHIKQKSLVVGGTKNIRIEKIKELNPDLIIANKEENTKEDIHKISEYFPVWITNVTDFDSAIDMMRGLGSILDCFPKSNELCEKLIKDFSILENSFKDRKSTVLYLIWKKPFMSIGSDTFIHSMLLKAGFDSVTKHLTRYPVVDENVSPDLVFLSSEPYPFKEKDVKEIQNVYPNSKLLFVDGEMFSWYGSRMLLFPSYIQQLKFGNSI